MAGGAGGTEVGRISIRVVPNTDRFRQELRAQLQGIENSVRCRIDVEPDLSGFRERIRAATSNLPDARIRVDVDRSALNRLGRDIEGIGRIGAGGFLGVGRGLLVVAAAAAFAAPALALISGVLTTLPGIIAAVATPIAAIVLGLDGIKAAASRVGPDLDRLKAIMSARFEEKLTPVFEKLREVFPTLEQSMPKVADGLAAMAQAFTDSVTSKEGLAGIQETISNIGKALTDSAPGVRDFTDGLINLASKITSKLPGLAQMFNGWGDSFNKWVEKITRPDWFSGKSPLDTAMTSLKETVKEVLNLFGDLAGKGFEFLSDPKFGEKMSSFVAEVKDFVNVTLPGLKTGFEDISGAVKGISDALTAINNFKPPDWMMIDPNNPNRDNGFGGFPGIGEKPKMDQKPSWLDDLESGAWIDQTVNSFKATITVVTAEIALLWDNVKTQALTAFTSIVTSAGAIWGQLTSIIQGVVSNVISTLGQVPAQVAGIWNAIPGIAAGIWNQVVSAVANALAQVVAVVVQGGAQVVGEVSSWPGKIAAALAGLAATGAEAGRALVQGLINGISGMIGAAVAKAGELAAGVANAVKGALGINSPSTVMHGFGENTGQGFINGLDSQKNKIVDLATQLMQAIKDVFGSAEGLTLNFNLGGAQTAMQGIATSAQDFSTSMNTAVPALSQSAGKVDAATRQQLDQLDIQKAQLALQVQQLQAQKSLAGDKGQKSALQQQIDQLQMMRQALTYQREQLEYQSKYSESVAGTTANYDDMTKSIASMPLDFAKSTVGQLTSDLGIGGQGALSQLVAQGMGFAEQFVFNVGSMDEALGGQQRIQNKKSLTYAGR